MLSHMGETKPAGGFVVTVWIAIILAVEYLWPEDPPIAVDPGFVTYFGFLIVLLLVQLIYLAYKDVPILARGDWAGFKSAFSGAPPARAPSHHRATGFLRWNRAMRKPVEISLEREGIRIVRRGLALRLRGHADDDAIFIPWTRVKSVRVNAPTHLDHCRSEKDRVRLSKKLSAELAILRGGFSPMTIVVPWREEFRMALPGRVKFIQTWAWPIGTQLVV